MTKMQLQLKLCTISDTLVCCLYNNEFVCYQEMKIDIEELEALRDTYIAKNQEQVKLLV